jgi:hypothetical protein
VDVIEYRRAWAVKEGMELASSDSPLPLSLAEAVVLLDEEAESWRLDQNDRRRESRLLGRPDWASG